MAWMRITLMTALLSALVWLNFLQPYHVAELWQIGSDWNDPRPARRIIILGNSRTGYNEMPRMLRHIADSAASPEKYQILTITPGGASFESLWGNRSVKQALGAQWDDAILQGESRGQSTPENAASFDRYGDLLLKALHPDNEPPSLIVNWIYDRSLFSDDANYSRDEARDYFYQQMQAAHTRMAERTGAQPINIGKVWEYLHAHIPDVPLTADGNHPTAAASYFLALCLYSSLSHQNVAMVRWAPDSLSTDTAARIRKIVDEYREDL